MFRSFILYSILILLPALVQGQHPVVRNYTVEDGLPSSEVYHVIQDREGYIWFSTDNGVSRFNGYEFENFDVQDGLPDNTILEMFEDYKGRIWFVSLSNKLSYFWNDSIYKYKYSKNIREHMKQNHLTRKGCFYVDSSDFVYYSLQGSYAIVVDTLGIVFPNFELDDNIVFGLGIKGKSRVVWSNNEEFDSSKNKHFIVKDDDGKQIKYTHDIPHFLYRDVCTQNNGRVYLTLKNEVLLVFNGEKKSTKLDSEIHWLNVDSKNNLWVGTPQGVILLDASTLEMRRHFLKSHSVTSVTEDSEGGYWFTTLKNSIYYMPNLDILSIQSKLPSKRIYSIEEYKNGLAVGYDTAAFSVFSRDLSYRNYIIDDVSFSRIMDLEYNKDKDELYIGSLLNLYKYSNEELTKISNKIYSTFNCKDLEIDKTGIWIANNAGLYYIDKDNNQYSSHKNKDFRVRTVSLKMDHDRLWIGSAEGLYSYKEGAYFNHSDEAPELANRIEDIEIYNERYLILAAKGSGILFYDRIDRSVLKPDILVDKIPTRVIEDIFVENDSMIWAATNLGAVRITIESLEKEQFNVIFFSTYNGLPSKEVNQIMIKDENAFFATNRGLAYIELEKVRRNFIPPPVYFKRIISNNHVVSIENYKEYDHDENTFSFEYIGLSYRKAGDLNYKYRMTGLDSTWIHTKQRIQRFTTLDPGRYTFEVVAQNEDGVWSSEPAVYSFQIKRPIYQQWWFLLSAFVLFFTSFWVLYKRRINALRKKNILLQSINSYKQKILSQQMNPHFIFNTLNSIQYYLLDEDINSSLHYLSQFAKLMRQILDNSQRNKITIEEELDALRLYLELESLRFEENLEYKIHVDKKINTFEWKILPLLLQPYVENSIKHGLLHKKGKGVISIELNLVDEKIQCIIEDNGVGREFTMNKNQKSEERHISWGAKISSDRIALLNSLYGDDIKVIYTDLKSEKGSPTGTRVEIFIPVLI